MLTLKAARTLLPICPLLCGGRPLAQLDPVHHNQIEPGIDQPLTGQGPQGVCAFYNFNSPEFFSTQVVLRVALASACLDSEVGFQHLISPYTDVGLAISGGIYGDHYFWPGRNFFQIALNNFCQKVYMFLQPIG